MPIITITVMILINLLVDIFGGSYPQRYSAVDCSVVCNHHSNDRSDSGPNEIPLSNTVANQSPQNYQTMR